ncbi:MAG: FAD:protein FMN transferase [Pirellulales bacterium]
MPAASRRRFLVACSTSAAGLTLATPADAALLDDCEQRLTGRAFGAAASLAVRHRTPELARRAADAAFRELLRVEGLLTLYRPDSPLVLLNRTGRLDRPPRELRDVLAAAQHYSELTHGAFDVTVQPLWELHARARRAGRLPDATELADARSRVDWRRVQIERDFIRLTRSDVQITLNGIAQGYVADCVRRTLLEHGVVSALIDAGEVSALGRRGGGEPWRVGIQHPREADAFAAVAQLAGRCLATSGDYSTSFVDDHSRHHVFDPRSGCSPTQLASVSIAAPTAMAADALATAALVLGPDRTARLIQTLPRVDALLVSKDGRMQATSGFPRL